MWYEGRRYWRKSYGSPVGEWIAEEDGSSVSPELAHLLDLKDARKAMKRAGLKPAGRHTDAEVIIAWFNDRLLPGAEASLELKREAEATFPGLERPALNKHLRERKRRWWAQQGQ